MTTNYGDRPGVEPRTMSAARERVIREHNVSLTGTPRDLREVLVELEQERILHAATLEALNEIAVNMTNHADKPLCAYVKRTAEAAIAQARGERGAL